tara:strand:+ start:7395 stop:7568 length:174 start_codon:yes stop_codon:yes gene_type:complete
MTNPNEITLESMAKLFEYEKQAREIDECRDVDQLQDICKMYAKLYFKQQEVVSKLGF